MNYGIIMEGDSSPLVAELSERLFELGLCRETGDTLTSELLGALNTYRAANKLIELDFCDPVTLRTLGIDAAGDELITLAGCAESLSRTKLECYDICREIVAESRRCGITVTEAAIRRGRLPSDGRVSAEAVTAAVLAFLHN